MDTYIIATAEWFISIHIKNTFFLNIDKNKRIEFTINWNSQIIYNIKFYFIQEI